MLSLGDALIFLADEAQVFSTNVASQSRQGYPSTLDNPNDVLLSSLYVLLNEIASFGKTKRIFVCIAGSHGTLKNLLVLSPCANHPSFGALLPLPLFNTPNVKEAVEYFFDIHQGIPDYKQLEGPARITQFFLWSMLNGNFDDWEEVIESTYRIYSQQVSNRIAVTEVNTVFHLTFFPAAYGGILKEDGYIMYGKGTKGYNLLDSVKDNKRIVNIITDSGLTRIIIGVDVYSIQILYPFTVRYAAEALQIAHYKVLHKLSHHLLHPGRGFEYLLRHELCNGSSPLYIKILQNKPVLRQI